jgi:hypothetical protein
VQRRAAKGSERRDLEASFSATPSYPQSGEEFECGQAT